MYCIADDLLNSVQPLQSAYAPFLGRRNEVPVFLTLNITDEHLSFNDLKQHGNSTYVGTTQLCRMDDGRLVVNHAGFRCITVPDFSRVEISKACVHDLSPDQFRSLNEALYQLARFRALFLNMLVLHASAVVYQDEVVLFSGMKGAGKSTQARLWLENTDAWVLNYDKPVVKLDDERVLVSGSPWGGKEDLAINEVRPAKALIFVHQAKENRMVRLGAAKAFSQAYLNYFVYPLNEDIEQRYNNALTQLVRQVPVYDLYCTDTKEAVEVVRKELFGE